MVVDVSRNLPDQPDKADTWKLLLFENIGRYYGQKKEPLLSHASEIQSGIAELLGKYNKAIFLGLCERYTDKLTICYISQA